jgi:hypothetical protein
MNNKVKSLINEQIAQSFVKEYQDKATDEEGLGLIVSHYFEWNGDQIIKAFCEALEDANFHSFRDEVIKLAVNKRILEGGEI